MKTLILFTQSFPYSKHFSEITFLKNEIKYLSLKFDNIYVFPKEISGEMIAVPENVKINKLFSERIACKKFNFLKNIFYLFNNKLFLQELLNRPVLCIKPKYIHRLFRYIGQIIEQKKWLIKELHSVLINETPILYTYWFTSTTTALTLIKDIFAKQQIKIISRAHGIDLYEERQGYIPLQNQTIKALDRLYLISDHGYNYIVSKYPALKNKCKIKKLGIEKNIASVMLSNKSTYTVVSCSSVINIKRVDLILNSLITLSQNTDSSIKWYHFGGGVLLDQLKSRIDKLAIPNLSCFLKGFTPNIEILNFYSKNNVRCFINVSSTEGIPVSIMEAQSFGIPIIATSVGGIPEIVNANTGILLNPNPTPDQIAAAIKYLIENPEVSNKMSIESKKNWFDNFNADKNFKSFVNDIEQFYESDKKNS